MKKVLFIVSMVCLCFTSCETKKQKMTNLIDENIKCIQEISSLEKEKTELKLNDLDRQIKLTNSYGSDTTGLAKKLSTSIYHSDSQINYIDKKIAKLEQKRKSNDSLVSILEK